MVNNGNGHGNGSAVNLHDWDYVMVNSSAGKDSQTTLRYVVQLAKEQNYPSEQIVVVHADLGEMEWEGVRDLAEHQARHYGLEFVAVERCTADGETETILDYVERRGKWPSSTTRYCTSDFKRGPCRRVITQLGRRAQQRTGRKQVRILNVFGFRAQESPARAKRKPFVHNERASSKSREVWDWLPIHDWTTDQVWADIHKSGVPYHRAYDLGMPRLSCCFCIFAPKPALMIAGRANPGLLQRYVDTERKIGHEFRKGEPLVQIQQDLAAGVQPSQVEDTGCWNM